MLIPKVQYKTGGIYLGKWFMKIGNEHYVNIKLICCFYGPDVCTLLPAFHSLTGCDASSFPFGCSKVKPYKKMLRHKKQEWLNDFGSTLTSSHHVFIDAPTFFQTIVYNGRELGSLLQTHINMYEKQINQSSLQLIPDRSSLMEHLK